jgi:hypothetical protein
MTRLARRLARLVAPLLLLSACGDDSGTGGGGGGTEDVVAGIGVQP